MKQFHFSIRFKSEYCLGIYKFFYNCFYFEDTRLNTPMSRCDHDAIFQRVFCITLVAIALTFTVILTNVFFDIDGLLSKDKVKTYTASDTEPAVVKKHHRLPPIAIGPRKSYKQESIEENELYRSKRSIEPQNRFFHLKNKKIKSLLARRLDTLLDELDKEEAESTTTETKKEAIVEHKVDNYFVDKEKNKDVKDNKKEQDKEDLLHLALHNILLQGIIEHTDVNEVYEKIQSFLKNFKQVYRLAGDGHSNNDEEIDDTHQNIQTADKQRQKYIDLSDDEKHILEEMEHCNKLRKDVADIEKNKKIDARKSRHKPPKLFIKTLIDITNTKRGLRDNTSASDENIKGIIKLIYNGKEIKFTRKEGDHICKKNKNKTDSQQTTEAPAKIIEEVKEKTISTEILDALRTRRHDSGNLKKMNFIIDRYLKNLPDDDENSSRRFKRQIKVRFKDDDATNSKAKENKNKDEELFVEIETHFNSKGINGEKRKKIIRNLINKIKKAIKTDIDALKNTKKKHKHVHVKKRVQSPFNYTESSFFNKIIVPLETTAIRNIDSISKVRMPQNQMPRIADKNGDNWKRPHRGPGFLTISKSLNSAELAENDVDYNKVLSVNGIPQRLQKPLNIGSNDDTYLNIGDLQFVIKSMDNGAMSIGFNQYTDEDPESVKIFTDIDNLVKSYQNYELESAPEDLINTDYQITAINNEHSIAKREIDNKINKHVEIKRSIKNLQDNDYHSNEYKMIFNTNYLPFDNYQEIYNDKHKRVAVTIEKEKGVPKYFKYNVGSINKRIRLEDVPSLIKDEELKPSEILTLANLLDRKRRSTVTKNISNLKNKMHLSSYLNTGRKSRQIIINKKRSKRHIDKIRIIATDALKPKHSDEEIFIVSDENLEADRAVIRENLRTFKVDDDRLGQEKPLFEVYDEPTYSYFFSRTRHNPLMSKYPHIFMEEISQSKEEYQPTISSNRIEVQPKIHAKVKSSTEKTIVNISTPLPRVDELLRALTNSEPKANYKLTVKIMPKNSTDANGNGFKEVHTSINKTFDKDGMKYFSIVNVSQISKIEKVTAIPTTIPLPATQNQNIMQSIHEQQLKMEELLKEHKKIIDEQLKHMNRGQINLSPTLPTMNLKNNPNIIQNVHQQKNDYGNPSIIQNIKEQKPKMDGLLREHATKIQLDKTKREPNEIDITSKANNVPTFTTTKPLQINEDEFFKKIVALINFHTAKLTTTTTTTETTVKTTTPTPPTTTADKPKTERAENVTNEILQQIKLNTQMLATFLKKLDLSRDKPRIELTTETPKMARFNLSMMKLWDHPYNPTQNAYFKKYMANVEIHKRPETIPYFYAYNQPSRNYKQINIPIANVVYHGHIEPNVPAPRVGIEANLRENMHRHFIDNLEDDFKNPLIKKTDKTKVERLMKNNTIKPSVMK